MREVNSPPLIYWSDPLVRISLPCTYKTKNLYLMEASEEMLCSNDIVTTVGAKKLILVEEKVLYHLLAFPPPRPPFPHEN